ncbi:MAG TPA: NAD(P)H-dependent oxidoreductase subunit E [Thermomicrobiales bacterium]|nr:NAD(P)H-dependent oxidoreductase subunit E [Thermomicrobiales bacterium]
MAHADQPHVMLPVPSPYTGRQDIDLDVVRELVSHFRFDDYEESQELLLLALQEINEHFGWVSPEAAEIVAEHLNTTVNRLYALLTFYADFRTEPRGHHHMLICHGMSCYVMGSQQLVQRMQDRYGVEDGETTPDKQMSVQVVNGCLGVCDLSPVVKIDDAYHGPVSPDSLTDLVERAVAQLHAPEVREVTHG